MQPIQGWYLMAILSQMYVFNNTAYAGHPHIALNPQRGNQQWNSFPTRKKRSNDDSNFKLEGDDVTFRASINTETEDSLGDEFQYIMSTEALPSMAVLESFPTNFSNVSTESQDISTDIVMVIFDQSQLVMTIIGFFANMATVVTLAVNGQGFSPVILLLLRHQSLIDAWICLMGAIMLIQPFMWLTGTWLGDILVCHVWHSQTVYWICVTISIYNLVAIAFERYLAVCHPFQHKSFTVAKFCWLILAIYLFNSLAVSPAYLQVRMEGDICVSEYKVTGDAGELLFYSFSIYYFILFYAIPTSLFFFLYGFVIVTFKRRQRQTNLASSRVIDRATTELTKTAVVVTAIFIIAMGYDFWYYLLGYTGVVVYKMNTPIQKIGVWLSAFNSVANPFVYALLMPAYMKNVKKTFCFCHKKEDVRPVTSENMVTCGSSTTS